MLCSFHLHARMVSQEKEVMVTWTAMGRVRAFSKEAYVKFYGREPGDDGLTPEPFTAPTGQSFQAYKAICLQSVGLRSFIFTESLTKVNHVTKRPWQRSADEVLCDRFEAACWWPCLRANQTMATPMIIPRQCNPKTNGLMQSFLSSVIENQFL